MERFAYGNIQIFYMFMTNIKSMYIKRHYLFFFY